MPVARVGMASGWSTYEIELPEPVIELGWNRVVLRFSRRVVSADPYGAAAGPRAAGFRYVRIRSALGRPFWPEQPRVIDVARVDEAGAAARLDMPTDSFLELVVDAGEHSVLTGQVEVVFADAAATGEIRATIDVVDAETSPADAHARTLFDESFTSDHHGPSPIVVALDEWAGQLVHLRVSGHGQANGIVRWLEFGLTQTSSPSVRRIRAGGLVAPPVSGRLGETDVIVIVLDAARADAFATTPALSALAEQGTRFEYAWAPASWTGQSVPSLFTGRHPEAVGAETWGSQIPEVVPTLAELLSGAGYFTTLWSQHNVYRGNATLRRGFEAFADVRSDVIEDRDLLPAAGQLFVGDRPTFAWIHLLPPHGPYAPPPPFRGALTDDYTGEFPISAAALNRAARAQGDERPTADDVRYVRARYDEKRPVCRSSGWPAHRDRARGRSLRRRAHRRDLRPW